MKKCLSCGKKLTNKRKEKFCDNRCWCRYGKIVVVAITCIDCGELIATNTKLRLRCNDCNKHLKKMREGVHLNEQIRKKSIIFDNPFPKTLPIEWHHVSNNFVFAIPKSIHAQCRGRRHREKMKSIVESLYNISYYIVE